MDEAECRYHRGKKTCADFIVLAIVATVEIVVFFLVRRSLRLQRELFIGYGVALVIAVFVILTS